MAFSMNAQIVYTDITDGVLAGIDFDSDGTLEFEISNSGGEGAYITYFNGGSDNNIHAIGSINTSDWDTPDCIAAGFIIDALGNWEGQGDASINAWGGNNPTVTIGEDEYLAMRFNLGGTEVYYGWVRFSMNANDEVTYKDYAYNSTPDAAIDAGDKGNELAVGSEVLNNEVNIYPNPTNSYFTVEQDAQNSITSIRIVNALGKEVFNAETTSMESNKVDVSTFKHGLYFVTFNNQEGVVDTKKLIIKQ